MIDHAQVRTKAWVLNQEAFDKLLSCLADEREMAGQQYTSIRRQLIKFFESQGCYPPADLSDETIDRVARRIYTGEVIGPSKLVNYFYGVARNILREQRKKADRRGHSFESMEHLIPSSEDPESIIQKESSRCKQERYLECLDTYIQRLSPENRQLLIDYYQGEKGVRVKNRKELAERLNITPNALKVRVHRIREFLESSMREDLERLSHETDFEYCHSIL